MHHQLRIIRDAYDKTVDRYFAGVEDEDLLPEEFKQSDRYKRFKALLHMPDGGSGDAKIREYLQPQAGMRFLDVGCCANLMTRNLAAWPSTYYGIDISPKLIEASQNFVKNHQVNIGGLAVADMAHMPFDDHFFDICAVIGIVEYFDIAYIRTALKELHRVMKPQGRIVLDFPNTAHPDCTTMVEMEGYLGRTRQNVPTTHAFEKELRPLFSLEKSDANVMKTYFLVSRSDAA